MLGFLAASAPAVALAWVAAEGAGVAAVATEAVAAAVVRPPGRLRGLSASGAALAAVFLAPRISPMLTSLG